MGWYCSQKVGIGYYYRLTTHNYVFEAFKYTESLISSYSPSSLSTVEIRIYFIA